MIILSKHGSIDGDSGAPWEKSCYPWGANSALIQSPPHTPNPYTHLALAHYIDSWHESLDKLYTVSVCLTFHRLVRTLWIVGTYLAYVAVQASLCISMLIFGKRRAAPSTSK